ncbi:hypothetical protein ElyMa_001225800 [Elysia marginata]|uniref:Uncharacterized protein n=1 Tax=Elysia marginata TaxID=1093978 RepID=A0AAV4I8T9_9GAST|nr:hypothetical protein ElyMa_001225800 [Elysia marginata]
MEVDRACTTQVPESYPQSSQWKPEGRRKRGRPKTTCLRAAEAEAATMGQSWGTLRTLAQDREKWRDLVAALVAHGKKGSDEHFRAADFDDDGFRRRLRRGVVPSIFKFPAQLLNKTTSRYKALLRQPPLPTKIVDQVQPQAAATSFIHDHGAYATKEAGPGYTYDRWLIRNRPNDHNQALRPPLVDAPSTCMSVKNLLGGIMIRQLLKRCQNHEPWPTKDPP